MAVMIINIVLMIVSIAAQIVTMLLAKKPNTPHLLPSVLEGIPIAEQGKRIPVVFGRRFVKQANVVWYGHVRAVPITMKPPGSS